MAKGLGLVRLEGKLGYSKTEYSFSGIVSKYNLPG